MMKPPLAGAGFPAAEKIPIVLITGFLGSGKTTFLNRLLSGAGASGRIGLLINDFGKIAVDGALILSKHPELAGRDGGVYEIANGSIFCSCLTSSFLAGLKYFAAQKPDRLYIETSGISDPSSMGRLLAESGLAGAFTVELTVCIVDPIKTPKLLGTLETIKKQIAAASHIVINKADLAEPGRVEETSALIRGINPEAGIVAAVQARVDPAFLARRRGPRLLRKAESCNTPENRPRSLLLPQRPIPRERLQVFLDGIAGRVLRLKGFYELGGRLHYVSDSDGKVSIETVDGGGEFSRGISILCDASAEEDIRRGWESLNP